MTAKITLVPFILLLTIACSNEDKTKDKLRNEIELKDRLNTGLKSELVQSQSELTESQAALTEEQKSLASSNEKIQNLNAEIETKNKKIAAIDASISEKNLTITNLEKAITDGSAERAALASEKNKVASDKAKLEKDLADRKAELAAAQASLNATAAREAELNKNIDALKADIKTKDDQIVKLDEKIKTFETAPDNSAINEMINKLEDAKKELAALKEEKAKADVELANVTGVIKGSMAPLWGMYFSRRSTELFDGQTCRVYVYVQPKGESINAIVCDDGRMQWEQRGVKSFAAVIDRNLDGDIGFTMATHKLDSSCKANTSVFNTGDVLAFDRGARFGISTFATGLSVKINKQTMVLDSASLDFTSSECEDLIALHESGEIKSAQDKPRLDGAARVCNIVVAPVATTEADSNVGCFMANDAFVK